MEIINVNTVDVITPNENTEILGLQNGNPIRINAAGLINASDVLKCTILTEEEYNILIDALDILPENFCNVEAIENVIKKNGGKIE